MTAAGRVSIVLFASLTLVSLSAAPSWAAPANGGTDQTSSTTWQTGLDDVGTPPVNRPTVGSPTGSSDEGTGYVPPAVSIPSISPTGVQPADGNLRATGLPSTYDLRTAQPNYGASIVLDQGSTGTCWAFTSAASAQASLVRNKVLSGETTTRDLAQEVSPLNLAQSVYSTGTFSGVPDPYNAGGNFFKAAAAWSHWYGAVTERVAPFPASFYTLPTPAANLKTTSDFHMRNAYFLPGPRDGANYVASNVQAIKQAIYNYGTVGISFAVGGSAGFAAGNQGYYNSTYKTFYNGRFQMQDHAVSVIGWDDTIPTSRFNVPADKTYWTNIGGPGAFLIKNSWGAGFYDYFYISYYDTTLGDAVVFDMGGNTDGSASAGKGADTYNRVYAQDELGYGNYLGTSGKMSQQYANVYQVPASPATPTALRAVQLFATTPDTGYTISVYLNASSATSPISTTPAPIGASGQTSITGTTTYAGYNTITLPTPAILTPNQKFSIVITQTVGAGIAYIPVERAYTTSGTTKDTMAFARGQTFVYDQSMSTPVWTDLVDLYSRIGSTGNGNAVLLGLASPAYTLTFNANGGTVSPASKVIAQGAPYGTLPTPTWAGHSFLGWFTSPTGTLKVTSATTMGTANATVYAQWWAESRLAGQNSVETAVAIAKGGWPVGGPDQWALIATKRGFPDAMAGGPLASAVDGPILLTANLTNGLEASVSQELIQLNTRHVIILGGTGVVSTKIQSQLEAIPGVATVERIGGATKYETATMIADRLRQVAGTPSGVFLTTGNNFPDALAASPVAAMQKWPIVFTPPKGALNVATAAWLNKVKPGKLYVLGGTLAVPAQAATQAESLTTAKPLVRLGGATLWETEVMINQSFQSLFTRSAETGAITIATSRSFADALVGGVFAAKQKAPLFLIDGLAKKTNTTVRNAISNWGPYAKLYVFGGTGAVTNTALALHVT